MFSTFDNAAEILILVYIIITFGYSALEKTFSWSFNLEYYKNHFKETLIKNSIPFLLLVVTLLELIVVTTCAVGVVLLILFNEKAIGFYGLVLTSITLIGLMFGQRIAKDYNGAMLITVYFILSVFGLFLLQ